MLVVRDGLWKGPSKMDVHVRPVWQAADAAASVAAREAPLLAVVCRLASRAQQALSLPHPRKCMHTIHTYTHTDS